MCVYVRVCVRSVSDASIVHAAFLYPAPTRRGQQIVQSTLMKQFNALVKTLETFIMFEKTLTPLGLKWRT